VPISIVGRRGTFGGEMKVVAVAEMSVGFERSELKTERRVRWNAPPDRPSPIAWWQQSINVNVSSSLSSLIPVKGEYEVIEDSFTATTTFHSGKMLFPSRKFAFSAWIQESGFAFGSSLINLTSAFKSILSNLFHLGSRVSASMIVTPRIGWCLMFSARAE